MRLAGVSWICIVDDFCDSLIFGGDYAEHEIDMIGVWTEKIVRLQGGGACTLNRECLFEINY